MYANFAEQKTLIVIEDSQDRLPIVGDLNINCRVSHTSPSRKSQGKNDDIAVAASTDEHGRHDCDRRPHSVLPCQHCGR